MKKLFLFLGLFCSCSFAQTPGSLPTLPRTNIASVGNIFVMDRTNVPYKTKTIEFTDLANSLLSYLTIIGINAQTATNIANSVATGTTNYAVSLSVNNTNFTLFVGNNVTNLINYVSNVLWTFTRNATNGLATGAGSVSNLSAFVNNTLLMAGNSGGGVTNSPITVDNVNQIVSMNGYALSNSTGVALFPFSELADGVVEGSAFTLAVYGITTGAYTNFTARAFFSHNGTNKFDSTVFNGNVTIGGELRSTWPTTYHAPSTGITISSNLTANGWLYMYTATGTNVTSATNLIFRSGNGVEVVTNVLGSDYGFQLATGNGGMLTNLNGGSITGTIAQVTAANILATNTANYLIAQSNANWIASSVGRGTNTSLYDVTNYTYSTDESAWKLSPQWRTNETLGGLRPYMPTLYYAGKEVIFIREPGYFLYAGNDDLTRGLDAFSAQLRNAGTNDPRVTFHMGSSTDSSQWGWRWQTNIWSFHNIANYPIITHSNTPSFTVGGTNNTLTLSSTNLLFTNATAGIKMGQAYTMFDGDTATYWPTWSLYNVTNWIGDSSYQFREPYWWTNNLGLVFGYSPAGTNWIIFDDRTNQHNLFLGTHPGYKGIGINIESTLEGNSDPRFTLNFSSDYIWRFRERSVSLDTGSTGDKTFITSGAPTNFTFGVTNGNTTIAGATTTNLSLAGSGVRVVEVDANGRLAAIQPTNNIGSGGSGTVSPGANINTNGGLTGVNQALTNLTTVSGSPASGYIVFTNNGFLRTSDSSNILDLTTGNLYDIDTGLWAIRPSARELSDTTSTTTLLWGARQMFGLWTMFDLVGGTLGLTLDGNTGNITNNILKVGTSIVFPDNTVQTTAATNGGGTTFVDTNRLSIRAQNGISDQKKNEWSLASQLDLDWKTPNRQTITTVAGQRNLGTLVYASRRNSGTNDVLFVGQVTDPAIFYWFTNTSDLSLYTTTNFDDYHGGIKGMTYSTTKDLAYVVCVHTNVSQFVVFAANPTNYGITDIITNERTAVSADGPAIALDNNNNLWVLSQSTNGFSKLRKYNLGENGLTATLESTLYLTNMPCGYHLEFDGENMYASSAVTAWIARINTNNTEYIYNYFTNYTPGIVIGPNGFCFSGDYIFAGQDGGGGNIVWRILKSDLSGRQELQFTGFDGTRSLLQNGKYIWIYLEKTATNGTLARYDPQTGEVGFSALQPHERGPGGLVTDGQLLYLTAYTTNSNFGKVIRMSPPMLTNVISSNLVVTINGNIPTNGFPEGTIPQSVGGSWQPLSTNNLGGTATIVDTNRIKAEAENSAVMWKNYSTAQRLGYNYRNENVEIVTNATGEKQFHGLEFYTTPGGTNWLVAVESVAGTAKLFRYNPFAMIGSKTVTNLTDGMHYKALDFAYSRQSNRWYVPYICDTGTTNNTYVITEWNPEEMTVRDIVTNSTLASYQITGVDAIAVNEHSIYVVGNNATDSFVFQHSLANGSLTATAQLTNLLAGHAGRTDGSNVWVTGRDSPAWIARVPTNCAAWAAAGNTNTFGGGTNLFTDDLLPKGDYVYVGAETPRGVYKINKATLAITPVEKPVAGACYGVFDAPEEWMAAAWATTPGQFSYINTASGEIRRYTAPAGFTNFNEITTDGRGTFWGTAWGNDPIQILRVTFPKFNSISNANWVVHSSNMESNAWFLATNSDNATVASNLSGPVTNTTGLVTGSGTSTKIAKFTAIATIGDSYLTESASSGLTYSPPSAIAGVGITLTAPAGAAGTALHANGYNGTTNSQVGGAGGAANADGNGNGGNGGYAILQPGLGGAGDGSGVAGTDGVAAMLAADGTYLLYGQTNKTLNAPVPAAITNTANTLGGTFSGNLNGSSNVWFMQSGSFQLSVTANTTQYFTLGGDGMVGTGLNAWTQYCTPFSHDVKIKNLRLHHGFNAVANPASNVVFGIISNETTTAMAALNTNATQTCFDSVNIGTLKSNDTMTLYIWMNYVSGTTRWAWTLDMAYQN